MATDVWASIRKAFAVKLNTLTLPSGVTIAWANTHFQPTLGSPWVRANLIPAQTRQGSIGEDGTDLHQGIFQVDVFYPSNSGDGAAFALADDILEHFSRGTVLIADGIRVRMETSNPTTPNSEPDWYHVPVELRWFSYTDK